MTPTSTSGPPDDTSRPHSTHRPTVTIVGSFRKDPPALGREHEELLDSGTKVLSPANTTPDKLVADFVFMSGETPHTAEGLEAKHLAAIEMSDLVWLHAPDGYIGLTGALEMAFALASGIPVYGRTTAARGLLAGFATAVSEPREALAHNPPRAAPCARLSSVLAEHRRRVATARGSEAAAADIAIRIITGALKVQLGCKRDGAHRAAVTALARTVALLKHIRDHIAHIHRRGFHL